MRSGEGRGGRVGREGRSRQSLGVQRGRGGPGSGRGQWQYCTYVRVGGHRVITLDGVGLPTSQDHWPTNLGFGAIRDRGAFRRGLKQKETHARVRIHKSCCSFVYYSSHHLMLAGLGSRDQPVRRTSSLDRIFGWTARCLRKFSERIKNERDTTENAICLTGS